MGGVPRVPAHGTDERHARLRGKVGRDGDGRICASIRIPLALHLQVVHFEPNAVD